MSKKKILFFATILLILALAFTACQQDAATTEDTTEETVVEETTQEEAPVFKACQVTDTGGIDDKSFNATAWKGMTDAEELFGVDVQYLESKQQTDYEVNISSFVEAGCDLIIPVGFLLADATAAAAESYPDSLFAIIDVDYLDAPNIMGSAYATDQATFLAGYLAAAYSETGVVATYGGIQFASVTIFMDGFYYGVQAYNEAHGTDVKVLGWDPATQEGLFVGNFDSTDDGKTMGETLMDEGADVIMPVAGPVGAGTLAAMKARETGLIIGVDSDMSLAYPEDADYILASATKGVDTFVTNAIEATSNGNFEAGNWTGTLENGGVGLTVGSAFDGKLDEALVAELDALQAGIIAGEIVTVPVMEAPAAEETTSDLGTEANPIVWAVVPSGETDRVVAGFEEVAAMIFDITGLYVEPLIATEYAGVIEAMCAEPPSAQMSSLATFAYILAAERGCTDAALVSVRYGSAVYNGQVFVQADSGIETIADLAGKTMCRPDPLSTSGWIIPSIELKAAGIDPETDLAEVVDAGSHDASVAQVYEGNCDAGTSYVDARTNLEEDYPDVMDKVVVISVSADIPNDGVQFSSAMSDDLKSQIVAALLEISSTDAGKEALSTAYSWNELIEKDDTFYDPFRQVLDAAGVSAEEFMK